MSIRAFYPQRNLAAGKMRRKGNHAAETRPSLPGQVINRDGRQVLDLLPGDAEPDAVLDPATAPMGIATSLRPQVLADTASASSWPSWVIATLAQLRRPGSGLPLRHCRAARRWRWPARGRLIVLV
jgi:hypothetical protein